MIKRTIATLLVAAFALSSTACIGRMATSGLVRNFNLAVVDSKWLIVNSIEFWSGTNPINGEPRLAHRPGDQHHVVAADGSEAISTLREDGSIDFEIRAADGSAHFVNVLREAGQVVARDAQGRRIAQVDSETGEIQQLDQTGSL